MKSFHTSYDVTKRRDSAQKRIFSISANEFITLKVMSCTAIRTFDGSWRALSQGGNFGSAKSAFSGRRRQIFRSVGIRSAEPSNFVGKIGGSAKIGSRQKSAVGGNRRKFPRFGKPISINSTMQFNWPPVFAPCAGHFNCPFYSKESFFGISKI